MNHVYRLIDAQIAQSSVVTIGVFDGVHRGHQDLIRRLVENAHSNNRLAIVLTFFPHPDVVLRGLTGRYYLTSPEQRAAELIKLGVDYVITHEFNETLRQMRAADFVDQLVTHLKIEELWVGSDFAMGYKREGDVGFLRREGERKGFTVETVELLHSDDNGQIISSTAIREAIQRGAVEQANELLGRAYSLNGKVVPGDARGRQIGFPTANIAVWDQQVLPENGVYAGWVEIDGQSHKAVTNIGIRPTFAGTEVRLETHLLDFDRDIYEKEISISFVARLRGEQKFNGIDMLVAQIHKDVAAARQLLEAQETS